MYISLVPRTYSQLFNVAASNIEKLGIAVYNIEKLGIAVYNIEKLGIAVCNIEKLGIAVCNIEKLGIVSGDEATCIWGSYIYNIMYVLHSMTLYYFVICY